MAKLKIPLFSFDARRKLGDDLVFARRAGSTIAEKRPEPRDARSLTQLSWRHMFQKVVALWHALSAAEKLEWESLARPLHMTGYAWFVSQALRPNPGIYLPLQGGTMQGDIDMDGYRVLDLPVPTANQEACTKAYADAFSKLVWKDVSERALSDANRTVTTAWTDLQLADKTSLTARAVLLRLSMTALITGTGVSWSGCRKNGTTPSHFPAQFVIAATPDGTRRNELFILGMDSARAIEWRVVCGAGATISTWLDVLGYFE